jgi:elongation factor P hydroxylase
MHDRSMQQQSSRASASFGAWYMPFGASAEAQQSSEHVATVGSAVDENSESMAEVKAKLSGDVRVNFKSDYLPLEKMATPEMMSVIQGNSTPYNPNSPSSAGRAAT